MSTPNILRTVSCGSSNLSLSTTHTCIPFRGILLHSISLQRPICLRHYSSGKFIQLSLIAKEVTSRQYDTPPGLQPPSEITRRRRWDHPSDSRSPSPTEASRDPVLRSNLSPEPQSVASTSRTRLDKDRMPQRCPSTQPRYTASTSRGQDSTEATLPSDVNAEGSGQPLQRKGKDRDMETDMLSSSWKRNISQHANSVNEEVEEVIHARQSPRSEDRAAIHSSQHDNPDITQPEKSVSSATRSRLSRVRDGRDDLKSSIRAHLSHLGSSDSRQEAGTTGDKGKGKIG